MKVLLVIFGVILAVNGDAVEELKKNFKIIHDEISVVENHAKHAIKLNVEKTPEIQSFVGKYYQKKRANEISETCDSSVNKAFTEITDGITDEILDKVLENLTDSPFVVTMLKSLNRYLPELLQAVDLIKSQLQARAETEDHSKDIQDLISSKYISKVPKCLDE